MPKAISNTYSHNISKLIITTKVATNVMAKGGKVAPPTKSEMATPVKAGGGTMQKYSPSPSQKTKDERNKPKIVNLMHPSGTCYGWAFHNFYAAKEELKSLSNRLGMITVIGGIEFKPFSNLTTKWLKESEFSGYIWVIRIDLELDGTDHCFPLTAHVAYGNKIARGVIAQNLWERGEVEVRTTQLSHAEALDLDVHFSVVRDTAADNAFDEAIREADSELEDLI
jgi:hypothetical protein